MSEVRLVVRDTMRDISGNCHGSLADRVIAALSAEPETIDELDLAIERFHHRSEDRKFLCWFSPGVRDEPWDAGLVIVDLAARLIAYESTYSSPGRSGSVHYHDGTSATRTEIGFHLPDDWVISSDVLCWETRAKELRQRRLADPPLDTRAVFYGPPLLEFIASHCFNKFGKKQPNGECQSADRELNAGEQTDGAQDDPDRYRDPDYDLIREIHALWLTTPRDDLRGQSPRDVLFVKREFITWDLQDRETQWSFQGQCPPPIERDSQAYRFAGFGIHEWVNYYDLLRHLLWSCHDSVLEQAATSANWQMFSPGDFLVGEVPRLEQIRDDWLDSPSRDLSGRTPREVNDNERRRVPEGMSGHAAVVDDDCPLCNMFAAFHGPMFWHLDGCNMDDDFAFSSCCTREEWEEERRSREEFNRRFEAEQAVKEELAVEYPGDGYADPDQVWQRSFSVRESAGESLYLRLFTIGSHLAEIIVELKQPPEDRALIDALKRDFDNLREVSRSGDLALAAALVEPVVEHFCETLSAVASSREQLTEQCDDLSERLRRFAEPPTEQDDDNDFGSGGEYRDSIDDDDIPF